MTRSIGSKNLRYKLYAYQEGCDDLESERDGERVVDTRDPTVNIRNPP